MWIRYSRCIVCDSIVSTTLIVDTVVYSTADLELCYGDSALFGGVMYDTSGVYEIHSISIWL